MSTTTINLKPRSRSTKCVNFLNLNDKKLIQIGLDFDKNHDLYSSIYKSNDINSKLFLPTFMKSKYNQTTSQQLSTHKNKFKNNKCIEDYQQQNNQLKIQNNKLKQQIILLKSFVKKKQQFLCQNLNPYADHWEINQKSQRIIRMRQQYQKLKKQYQHLQSQLSLTKNKLISTGSPQIQIYIQQLLTQNNRLKQYLSHQSKQKVNKTKNPTIQTSRSRQHHQKKLQDQLKKLQDKFKLNQNKYKQQQQAIINLENQLIKKTNNQYQINKKLHKLQKYKQSLHQQYLTFKNQHSMKIKFYQVQIIRLQDKHTNQLQSIQQQNQKYLKQKDKKITQLQKLFNQLNNNHKSRGSSSDIYHKTKSGQTPKQNLKSPSNSRNQVFNNTFAQQSQISAKDRGQSLQLNKQPKQIKKNKPPQKFIVDNPQSCRKYKKIQFSQIQPIGQLLYYRMVAYNITLTQMKKYFDYKPTPQKQPIQLTESKGEQLIILQQSQKNQNTAINPQQNITIKQTQQILKSHPFNLTQDQTYKLSRYLIQDNYNEQTQLNYNKRPIVKSIIKTVIGDWSLISQHQSLKINQQLTQSIQILKKNIQFASPNGTISKIKLVTLLADSQFGKNQKNTQFLLSKLCALSNSIHQLHYQLLFQNIENK